MSTEAKTPQPGEFWIDDKSGARMLCHGITRVGLLIFETAGGNIFSCCRLESSWQHAPWCTSWDSVEPKEQEWVDLTAMDGHVLRTGIDNCRLSDSGWAVVSALTGVTVGEAKKHEWREFRCRIEDAPKVVEQWPKYYEANPPRGSEIAFVRRDSKGSYSMCGTDGTYSTNVFTWTPFDDENRKEITTAEADALLTPNGVEPEPEEAIEVNPGYGYRWLTKGERIAEGDQAFRPEINEQWRDVGGCVGERWHELDHVPIRRKIEQPPVESTDDWVTQDRADYDCRRDQRRWVDIRTGQVTDEWESVFTHGRHGDILSGVYRLELRCRRKDLPPIEQKAEREVYLYWYDGNVVGRYADCPPQDPSFTPLVFRDGRVFIPETREVNRG